MANNQAKVLIFSTAYLPLVGGAEIAVKEITDRLDDFEFDLITARIKLALPGFEKQGRLNIYRIGLGWGSLDKFLMPIFGFLKAGQLNKKRNYQLIWSIMASQAGVAASFFKIFHPKKKLLLTIQEGDPEEHLERYVLGIGFLYRLLIRPWYLLPFNWADYITVISHDLKKRAQRTRAKAVIEVVPNGVDIEKFKVPNAVSKTISQNLKKELGIKQGEKVLIHSGRIAKKNGLDDLIKASKYLGSSIKILILGDGPDRRKLENLAESLETKDQIIFLGKYNNDDLPKYLAIADVFVRPSLSEGQGISFLEAMASGVPIIGTPVGGIPDFLIDRETGLFCQVRNPQSIAEKVKEIMTDEQLKRKIIENGIKLVREKYNWHNIAFKMKMVYKKLI